MTSEPQLFTTLTTGKPAARGTACGQTGRYADWRAFGDDTVRRRPICNRARGHLGPHRVYDTFNASVRAEWT